MIYIISGPTGSGKTSLALSLADYFNAPIINADAFQIYKDMDVGTAKISKDDPFYKRHYLLDILTPEETYSVKQYQDDFRKTVEELSKTYKDIIVCGGTGLYIRAAIYDYSFQEEIKDDTSDLEKLSNEELYEMLKKVDYASTEKIHMNNRKRVIRALSIARTTGTTKSKNISSQEHKLVYPKEDIRMIMLSPDRELLYENINKRVDIMFKEGLVNEVKSLLNKYDLSLTSREAIGYKEVIDYLEEKLTLKECSELIKQRTRNYAKRQITFFKNQFELEIYKSKEEAFEAIVNKK